MVTPNILFFALHTLNNASNILLTDKLPMSCRYIIVPLSVQGARSGESNDRREDKNAPGGVGVALEIQKSQARRDLRRPFLVFSATCAPLIHDF
jgi:hypothetical protein